MRLGPARERAGEPRGHPPCPARPRELRRHRPADGRAAGGGRAQGPGYEQTCHVEARVRAWLLDWQAVLGLRLRDRGGRGPRAPGDHGARRHAHLGRVRGRQRALAGRPRGMRPRTHGDRAWRHRAPPRRQGSRPAGTSPRDKADALHRCRCLPRHARGPRVRPTRGMAGRDRGKHHAEPRAAHRPRRPAQRQGRPGRLLGRRARRVGGRRLGRLRHRRAPRGRRRGGDAGHRACQHGAGARRGGHQRARPRVSARDH